jgi:hypothetical protein
MGRNVARRLNNWLSSFMEWTAPRSEAPENFIVWTGMFTLAASLRRRVWIPEEYMGSYSIYPNLYVMFIAPQGKVRKTTTVGYSLDLLERIKDLTSSPTSLSKEALLQKLIESSDSSVYIISEEFSDLLHKSGDSMYEFLVSVYDGKRHYEGATVSRGTEFVSRPCMNMLACTTPIWVAENMREDVIGGGYSSRVIYVYEEKSRQRRLFYKNKIDFENVSKLKTDLTADLLHISSLEGPFTVEDKVLDTMEEWYQTRKDEPNWHLQGYHERKPTHILKTAMLYSLCYSDKKNITEHDIEMAKSFIENTEKNLPKVFDRMGKNEYVFDTQAIYNYILNKKVITRPELLRHFNSVATPAKLDELLEGMLQQGLIKSEFEATMKMVVYHPIIRRMDSTSDIS